MNLVVEVVAQLVILCCIHQTAAVAVPPASSIAPHGTTTPLTLKIGVLIPVDHPFGNLSNVKTRIVSRKADRFYCSSHPCQSGATCSEPQSPFRRGSCNECIKGDHKCYDACKKKTKKTYTCTCSYQYTGRNCNALKKDVIGYTVAFLVAIGSANTEKKEELIENPIILRDDLAKAAEVDHFRIVDIVVRLGVLMQFAVSGDNLVGKYQMRSTLYEILLKRVERDIAKKLEKGILDMKLHFSQDFNTLKIYLRTESRSANIEVANDLYKMVIAQDIHISDTFGKPIDIQSGSGTLRTRRHLLETSVNDTVLDLATGVEVLDVEFDINPANADSDNEPNASVALEVFKDKWSRGEFKLPAANLNLTIQEGFLKNQVFNIRGKEPCFNNPCKNRGTCAVTKNGKQHKCTCVHPYEGPTCQSASSDVKGVQISVRFSNNYDSVEGKEDALAERLKDKMAMIVNASKSRFQDILLKPGSILMSLTITPGSPPAEQLAKTFHRAVLGGNMTFDDVISEPMVADTDSYTSDAVFLPCNTNPCNKDENCLVYGAQFACAEIIQNTAPKISSVVGLWLSLYLSLLVLFLL